MKKLIIATCLVLGTLSAYAQSVVTAEKTMEFADLCYFKQVQMKGYAYANLIGRCTADSGLNAMTLTLVAKPVESADPMEPALDAHKIELGEVQSVKLVDNKLKQLKVSVAVLAVNESGEIITKFSEINVRSLNVGKATFNLTFK